jgi:hypothetical protein
VPPIGLEPSAKNAGESQILTSGGAESGALGAQSALDVADLQFIIESWSRLPGDTKVRILALVRAGGGEQ